MKRIILYTNSHEDAKDLANQIVRDVRTGSFNTWAYDTIPNVIGGVTHIIYHNRPQYVNDPEKHVVFSVRILGDKVVLTPRKRPGNTEVISEDMKALHMGRLLELLIGMEYGEGIEIQY